MIRVGFLARPSKGWIGGINYLNNLLFAIHSLEDKKIEPIVFVGKKCSFEYKTKLGSYAELIQTSLLDHYSIANITWKGISTIFNSQNILELLLSKHNIDVLSHSNVARSIFSKTINWIPDFQHTKLPYMFSHSELQSRDRDFINLIRKSNRIIVSSNDALKDFNLFIQGYENKVDILPFVSQVDPNFLTISNCEEINIKNKYSLENDFFYIPNQFWKHKNHIVVFKAIKILKDRGINIEVICTGFANDYRHKKYMQSLYDYITENDIQNNVHIFGIVPYDHVFYFMKKSLAVINPSLFEGWSSTVEECKSIGKKMILSDISVHKEQNPDASFFITNDPKSLAEILNEVLQNPQKEIYSHKKIKEMLNKRTEIFAEKYQNCVLHLYK
ncbi:glycosyltransferase [Desulfoluna spongiiphila]|uniref:glycosyltransferase n=1 Tax=Desulfoluna spongiiphila TaxID=419481 RepID=UPI00125806D8|nr:glycosyltransferase [Desulfoluna spongiiphila]VVS90858.1 glycosyl transferase family 1 [Desulfoluna spongiiphila]